MFSYEHKVNNLITQKLEYQSNLNDLEELYVNISANKYINSAYKQIQTEIREIDIKLLNIQLEILNEPSYEKRDYLSAKITEGLKPINHNNTTSKPSKIAEDKGIISSKNTNNNSNKNNDYSGKSVISNKTNNTSSQSKEKANALNTILDKRESAEKRLVELASFMQATQTDCIKEISKVSEELHQLEIELKKLIPDEVYEKPLAIVIPEKKIPFGERAESISKSLKLVGIDDVTKLWNQWELLDKQYPAEIKEFFIEELRQRLTTFFSSVRYSSKQEGVAGIDRDALQKVVEQLEDSYSLDMLSNPYRLECGHRLSKESLVDLENKCTIKECKTDEKPVEDTILGELIQLILKLNK